MKTEILGLISIPAYFQQVLDRARGYFTPTSFKPKPLKSPPGLNLGSRKYVKWMTKFESGIILKSVNIFWKNGDGKTRAKDA